MKYRRPLKRESQRKLSAHSCLSALPKKLQVLHLFQLGLLYGLEVPTNPGAIQNSAIAPVYNESNDLVDLLGRNPCALRQMANFVGDHGKASPVRAQATSMAALGASRLPARQPNRTALVGGWLTVHGVPGGG